MDRPARAANGHAAAVDDKHDYPPHHGMSPGRYLATRITSLKPPMRRAPNPIRLIRMLDRTQWAFFLVVFFAWVCIVSFHSCVYSETRRGSGVTGRHGQTWDAFDFFTVSLTVGDLAVTFGRSNTDITCGIMLMLMFRSVGSILFGYRRRPLRSQVAIYRQ